MRFADSSFTRVLDSSYVRQISTAAFIFLVVTLISMIAIGCLFRAIASDHVQEMLLQEASTLNLRNRSRAELETYLQTLFSQRPDLANHSLYISADHHTLLGNAVLRNLVDCDSGGCRINNLSEAAHLVSGMVGVSLDLGNQGIFMLVYDMHEMLTRVQLIPLVTGFCMLLVLLVILLISMRFGLKNLRRIDDVLKSMHHFSAGSYDVRMPAPRDNDEIDRLSLAVGDNLKTIRRLLSEVSGLSHHIAHEMRTPLTRLHNHLADIIEKCPCSIHTDLVALQGECESIQCLFSALLQLGQIETRRCHVNRDVIQIADVIQDISDYYQPLAEQQGNRIVTRVNPSCVITADRPLMIQVINNLVENALKYAEGCGDITISCERNGDQCCLSVTDQGPGIPGDSRERAIERFTRLSARNSNKPGYGLGLTLVRAVTDLHQGTLTLLDNQPGLKVQICLPVIVNKH